VTFLNWLCSHAFLEGGVSVGFEKVPNDSEHVVPCQSTYWLRYLAVHFLVR
jgi:hypothetical protein